MSNLSIMSEEEKKDAFVILLYNRRGNIDKTCKDLGITRRRYEIWIEEDEEFGIACQETAS